MRVFHRPYSKVNILYRVESARLGRPTLIIPVLSVISYISEGILI